MTVPKSIKRKPKKPRKDWPLTASTNGQWVKKIRGKVYSFGRWDEPNEALQRFIDERDHIYLNGCRPVDSDGIRLDAAIKEYLDRQLERRDGKRGGKPISDDHYQDQREACQFLLDAFSRARKVPTLKPTDFVNLYKVLSVRKNGKPAASSTVRRRIANVRTFFNWLYKTQLIPVPIQFGDDFTAPVVAGPQDELSESEILTPADIWSLIDCGNHNVAAMIWLGLNTGATVGDFCNLTQKAIDLSDGYLTWKRWKVRNWETAKVRVIPLWPETIKALQAVDKKRPEATDRSDNNLFFLNRLGRPFDNTALSSLFGRIKKRNGIGRKGVGFHSFRDVIETYGGIDVVAINWIMGHIEPGQSKHYRETVPEERINDVLDNVRAWLGERPE